MLALSYFQYQIQLFHLRRNQLRILKSLALELGIDTSKCIEKSDPVSVLKNAKNEEAAEDHYENATNEKATLNQHEKKKRRRATKIHESAWYSCNIIEETGLLYNIDGTCSYRIDFNPNKRMKCSIEDHGTPRLLQTEKDFME